ncbi:phosphotransferase [Raoultibacter phocaeensis]|uniref:phosphotransferase n=1 Tax=Raoultibacter phocaeensis TaxID=2479841 RepID=UPI0011197E3C|nr:phosphotransferase [Raoultibacter phocaeensis]
MQSNALPLSKPEFLVLEACFRNSTRSQREIAASTGLSLGTVNAVSKKLAAENMLGEAYRLTEVAYARLEPYRVENAVIMAAGFASRFAPISYDKPKGLLNVKGDVLIERQIRQLKEAGIDDITIVVGYKKEQFFYLEDLFGVSLVVNEEYTVRNNHSSLWLVREKLGNTYVCSSDNYFPNNVFSRYEYEANIPGVLVEGRVTEWVMELGKDDRIIEYGETTCDDRYVALGQVYFDRTFSKAFVGILAREYDLPQTKPKLWDQIFAEHTKDLYMVMKPFEPGSILEFDSLDDLRAFDPDFIVNVDSAILDNICSILGCSRTDIHGVQPIKEGLTNLSFRFSACGSEYVYRHPGNGSENLVDRRSETEAEHLARELGLDRTFVYEDPEQGWKISRFVEVVETFDYGKKEHVDTAMKMVRTLHDAGKTVPRRFDAYEEARKLADLMYGSADRYPESYRELFKLAEETKRYVDADGVAPVLVHGDAWGNNILVSEDGFDLIDWEYAATGDYGLDMGSFLQHFMTEEETRYAIDQYFGGKATEEEYRHSVAGTGLSKFYWTVWAGYEAYLDQPIGEDEFNWYRFCKRMMKQALGLYEK